MAIQFPFIGGSYQGDSNTQECKNLIYVPDYVGGKPALVNAPGLTSYKDTGTSAEIRGMAKMGDKAYIVAGKQFFSLDTSGNLVEITAGQNIILTITGIVDMSNNGTQLYIDDGTYGYLYTVAAGLVLLTDTRHGYPGAGSSVHANGYFIVSPDGTDNFYFSGLENGLTWDALDFTAVQTPPGDIIRVYEDHEEIFVFKSDRICVYRLAPSGDYVFSKLDGAHITIGLKAKHSVVSLDNTIYWLSDNLEFCKLSGYNHQVISTPQISEQLRKLSTTSDATAFGYAMGGESYYQINFPTDGVTWLYQIAANIWTKRSSYKTVGSGDSRHRANCYLDFNNLHLVGDYENGLIYRLNPDDYHDNGNRIIRTRRTAALDTDGVPFRIWSLRLQAAKGVGLISGQGSEPKAMLKYSSDGGYRWSDEIWADLGAMGQYGYGASWDNLGISDNWVIDISVSDPVKLAMTGALINDANVRT